MQVHGCGVAGADVAAWPDRVGILCKFSAFLLCIGLWILLTWVILEFLFWRSLSFSSNGLVIGCSVKRLLGHMCEPTVLFLFPLCLFQRESKFDMAVSISVVWLEL